MTAEQLVALLSLIADLQATVTEQARQIEDLTAQVQEVVIEPAPDQA